MIILGIDYGKSKLGFALSDETELVARPLAVKTVNNLNHALQISAAVIIGEKAEFVVVGFPRSWNNQSSELGEEIKAFARELALTSGKQVELFDETYSSKTADKYLKRNKKAKNDAVAASIILQGFLDYKHDQI